MIPRPKVVRPRRTAPHSARVRRGESLVTARTPTDSLTTDDITRLKREKQELLQERCMLKAKLVRYENFTRHPKALARTQPVAVGLERRIKELEEISGQLDAEIAELVYSDRAAVVTELQEESKMLHLELMRIRTKRQETETEIADLSQQLEDACTKYSPEALARQQQTIKSLQREIAQQRARNDKIREKVEGIKRERESREGGMSTQVKRQVDEIKARIRKEQQEIADIDKEMEKMKEEHNKEMQVLHAKL